jgi:hypothetical protein
MFKHVYTESESTILIQQFSSLLFLSFFLSLCENNNNMQNVCVCVCVCTKNIKYSRTYSNTIDAIIHHPSTVYFCLFVFESILKMDMCVVIRRLSPCISSTRCLTYRGLLSIKLRQFHQVWWTRAFPCFDTFSSYVNVPHRWKCIRTTFESSRSSALGT